MYYTNRFLMFLFLFHTNKRKKKIIAQWLLFLDIWNLFQSTVFSNVQNQENNWKSNNKRSKETLLRNFPFSYLCTSIMSVPQVFSTNGYKVMFEYSCENYQNRCLIKNIKILWYEIFKLLQPKRYCLILHTSMGFLKLCSDFTQYENHWRQFRYFSYKNQVNMVIWELSL